MNLSRFVWAALVAILCWTPTVTMADDTGKDAILKARMATAGGDFKGCVDALKAVDAPEHRMLGYCYERLGDDKKALIHYRIWLESNGSSMRAASVRARVKTLERAPIVALEREARDLMIKADLAGCIDRMDKAVKLGSTAWHQLGLCHERAGDKDKAIAAYVKWLALAPDGEDAGRIRRKLDKLQSQ
jgi:tetratricopeptide (TPR) repeat protein